MGKLIILRNERKTFPTLGAKWTFPHLGGRKPEKLVKPMKFNAFLGPLGAVGHFSAEKLLFYAFE